VTSYLLEVPSRLLNNTRLYTADFNPVVESATNDIYRNYAGNEYIPTSLPSGIYGNYYDAKGRSNSYASTDCENTPTNNSPVNLPNSTYGISH